MCGRFAATLPPEAFKAAFGYADDPWFPPRFNIAPTQPIAIVRAEIVAGAPQRRFALVRWGFVPAYVKGFDAFKPAFNVGGEALADRPMVRNAMRRRRCLVVADGYYVWRHDEGRPQALLVRRADGAPFGMAGLWEPWAGADGSEIDTACIVTAPATGGFAGLNRRRPVVIDPADSDRWLDPDETRFASALPLLDAPPAVGFEAVPIGPLVNKAGNDGPELQTPAGPTIPLPAEATAKRPPPSAQGELF